MPALDEFTIFFEICRDIYADTIRAFRLICLAMMRVAFISPWPEGLLASRLYNILLIDAAEDILLYIITSMILIDIHIF